MVKPEIGMFNMDKTQKGDFHNVQKLTILNQKSQKVSALHAHFLQKYLKNATEFVSLCQSS